MALSATADAPLANGSNTELDSILDHNPMKENEGGWGRGGGYGYSGLDQSSSGAPYNGRSREETASTHFEPYTYQPRRRDHTETSDSMISMHRPDGSNSSHVENRQGQSTNIYEANVYPPYDSYQTPTQQTFSSPQQQWQPPAVPVPVPAQSSANLGPADRSLSPPPRKVDTNVPSTGLHNFGVTLTDSGPTRPTLSVNTAHVSKKSVEMRSHAVGRSFRASVEGVGED